MLSHPLGSVNSQSSHRVLYEKADLVEPFVIHHVVNEFSLTFGTHDTFCAG